MLVLSRNAKQGIQFPGLGISVEIIEIAGNKVKVGIDAPMEVRVLRNELVKPGKDCGADFRMKLPKSMQHELRNALHELSLKLHVYLKRIEREDPHTEAGAIDAEEMFQAVVKRLERVGGRDDIVFEHPESGVSPIVGRPSNIVGSALVVDDDDNERELLAGFLRMCDYDVDTVRDGIEAENYLNRHSKPRFILLDMFMPRCNGQRFLSSLRQNRNFDNTHVFVVSGSSPTELNMSVREGYTHWFNKPLDPRRIVDALTCIESDQPQEKLAVA